MDSPTPRTGPRFFELISLDLATADARIPGGRWVLLAVVGFTLLAFSGLRLGISQIYTESIPFLLLALAIGVFGRGIGLVFVIGHVILDTPQYLTADRIAASWTAPNDYTAIGRVAAALLLLMLVVLVPWLGRVVEWQYQRRRSGRSVLFVAAGPAQ